MKYKYDVFISYSRRDYVDENYNVIPGNAIAEIQNGLHRYGQRLTDEPCKEQDKCQPP